VQFFFENHVLDAERRELRRGAELVAIEPQVFDLLLYLIENRDRVLSKNDLIAGVWGGRIVSDSTLTSRINAARKAVGDNGRDQRLIRTAARKGLRFVGEVREVRRGAEGGAQQPDSESGNDPLPQLIADRPSIAVLPFDNLSDDRALELTATGLVEDIIALLARVPGFFVIARASSFAYVKRPIEIRQIAAELGVRYVVTGSARSSADRVRIAVQLIEAESGNQLWAGRYDVERADTLDLQDEIARRIMIELEPALTKADLSSVRRRRTDSVDAWSHYRQGAGAIAVYGWNEQWIAEALRQFGLAIAMDPNFALAHANSALLNAFGANLSLVDDAQAAKQRAREQAECALALDPNASDVLGLAGCALADIGELQRGVELLRRAVELDPSNAQAHMALGAALCRLGNVDEGLKSMQFGIRSSPKDYRLTFWNMLLADSLGRAGRYEEALAIAAAAARQDGRLYGARVVLAWVLSKLGRAQDARAALAEARRIRPALSLESIRRFFGSRVAADLAPIWD
jgi:TolB-like protein